MEQISEYLIEHWIILLTLNILAIIYIVYYIFGKINRKKNSKKEIKNDADNNIFDNKLSTISENEKKESKTDMTNTILNTSNPENIRKTQDDKNINTIDNETKKQLHNNIDYIVNQNNSIFEEFDKVIPEKKIIDDNLKEELEKFDDEYTQFTYNKKNIDIDTNIELPEIKLSTEEEDIWN